MTNQIQTDLEKLEQLAKEEPRQTMIWIPIDKLFPHPDNPRRELGDLEELTESIKARGVMQNLTVIANPDDTNTFHDLLDGKDEERELLDGTSELYYGNESKEKRR